MKILLQKIALCVLSLTLTANINAAGDPPAVDYTDATGLLAYINLTLSNPSERELCTQALSILQRHDLYRYYEYLEGSAYHLKESTLEALRCIDGAINRAMIHAIKKYDILGVQIALSRGADINSRYAYCSEICAALAELGGRERDYDYYTPLQLAILLDAGSPIITLLLAQPTINTSLKHYPCCHTAESMAKVAGKHGVVAWIKMREEYGTSLQQDEFIARVRHYPLQ